MDVKPLLDLCKIMVPDIIELTAAAQVLHSFCNIYKKQLKCSKRYLTGLYALCNGAGLAVRHSP
jgi:hypothetical protein